MKAKAARSYFYRMALLRFQVVHARDLTYEEARDHMMSYSAMKNYRPELDDE